MPYCAVVGCKTGSKMPGRIQYQQFSLPATKGMSKEVQIVYRLLLVNCYLLHVPRLPSQPASNVGG